MLIDLYLIDGNVLRNCNLYPEDVKNDDMPIVSKEKIDQLLSKVPWGFKYVSFQTKALHGQIHVNNIERYELSGTVTLKQGAKVEVINNTSLHNFVNGEIVKFIGYREDDGEQVFVFENEDDLEQGLYVEDFKVL